MPYTSTHWGIRKIVTGPGGEPLLRPYDADPDSNDFGLDQLADSVQSKRVQRPAVRESFLEDRATATGAGRGQERFVDVDWDTALDLAASEIARVREMHGNGAIFGGSYGWSSAGRFHHAQSQVHRFLNSVGGYVAHRNTYSLGAAHVILPRIVMPMGALMHSHTDWDTLADHCELFVTFGGLPAKNAKVSAGGVAHHRLKGALRRMAERGVRFVNIGPERDNIDAVTRAQWIAVRPNTDTAFMLGLAYVLATEGHVDRAFLQSHCVGYDKFEPYLLGETDGIAKTPDWAASITGADPATIRALARQMVGARVTLNMAWALQRAAHGEQPCWMIVTLAAMLGQVGLPGGGFGIGYGAVNSIGSDGKRLPAPTLPQGTNPVSDFIPVARIADMLLRPGSAYDYDGNRRVYPDIRLIYWAGGNPFHHHQDINRLRLAWQRPEAIIVNECYWTATAQHADIVFPATIPLEREDIGYGSLEHHMLWMSPATAVLGEARDDFDIFAALAHRLGAGEVFTEGRTSRAWLEHLYEHSREAFAKAGHILPEFSEFCQSAPLRLEASESKVLLEAFRKDPAAAPLATPSGRIEIFSDAIEALNLDDCPGHPCWIPPAEWPSEAGAKPGQLHLLSDQPAHKLHSQLDHGTASQRSKTGGIEQVRMSADDAIRFGLGEGDTAVLSNERGQCLASVRIQDGLMAGTAILSTGAWYAPDQDGLDRSGNPNVLTADIGTSKLAQGSTAQTCLIEVKRHM